MAKKTTQVAREAISGRADMLNTERGVQETISASRALAERMGASRDLAKRYLEALDKGGATEALKVKPKKS